MGSKLTSYLQLHLAVLLYGLTAILGDLISLNALNLVWWRVLITSLSLLFFVRFGLSIIKMPKKDVMIFVAIGFLVALHWVSFYGAIKLANASIVLAAMATTSFFTSLIEPIVTKKKFKRLEILLGLAIVPPMLMISQTIDISLQTGLLVALLSAFLASLFASFNKKYIERANSFQISFIEMGSAFLLLSCIVPFYIDSVSDLMPKQSDWIYLIVLSLLCTTFAYVISMKALRHLSAFDSNLVINLEPVYGIILAIVILKEHNELSLNFYIAVGLIMIIVFSHPFLEKYFYGSKKL